MSHRLAWLAATVASLAFSAAARAETAAPNAEKDLPAPGRPDVGAACTPGAATILFDLGNDPFREPTENRRLTAARVGANLASGVWAAGCIDGDGNFQEETVREGQSVRLVLLNARPDLDYTLLVASGALQPSEKLALTRLDDMGPVCGRKGTDCDVDASELDDLLRQLGQDAEALQKAVDRRTYPPMHKTTAAAVACARSLGREDCQPAIDPVAPATSARDATVEWWGEFGTPHGTFRGDYLRFSHRRDVLCRKWAARIEDYAAKYDPQTVRTLTNGLQRWSDEAARALKNYVGVRRLLAELRTQPVRFREAFEGPVMVGTTTTTTISGITALRELESYHYYRSNGLRFCAGVRDLGLDPKFAETAHAEINRPIADALYRYRDATNLLDHAYSARVFGLRAFEGNTDVVVTVYASPGRKDTAGAGAPAASGKTEEKGGESTQPVPYQLTFPVEGRRRLAFTFGTAAALFQRRTGAYDTVSPAPRPLVFLNWALLETRRYYVEKVGLQVGINLTDARKVVSGNDPGPVDVYAGAVFWPLRSIALGVGLVDSVSFPKGVQLGVYFSASADVLAVLDAWKGPKTVLAQ